MKKLYIDKTNRLSLDSQFTNVNGLTVKLSLIGESGEPLMDSNLQDIEDTTVDWDNTANKYIAVINLHPETPIQFARAFWYAADIGDNNIELEGFQPEDLSVEAATVLNQAYTQILPVSMFLDDYIASQSKMDDSYRRSISRYINKNVNKFREELLVAQGNLEMRLKMRFFATKDHQERDYYEQEFRSTWWQLQFDWSPVISIEKWLLTYGANPAVDLTQNIAEYMKIEHKMGTAEFVPTALNGTLWAALITNLSALGITIMADGAFNRIPLLFNIDYTHGLNYPVLPEAEKASIRWAIGRNALINLLPRVDPSVRFPSQSTSGDGVSKSQSSQVKDLVKDYREEEDAWVKDYARQYAKHFDIVVV